MEERMHLMEQRMQRMEEMLDLSPGPSWSPAGTPLANTSTSEGFGTNSLGGGSDSGMTSQQRGSENDQVELEYGRAKYQLTVDDTGNVSAPSPPCLPLRRTMSICANAAVKGRVSRPDRLESRPRRL